MHILILRGAERTMVWYKRNGQQHGMKQQAYMFEWFKATHKPSDQLALTM